MKYYILAFKKYAQFQGRSRRSEYWYFILFNIIFAFVATGLDRSLNLTMSNAVYGPVYGIYSLIVFIPGLALTIRRLHDVGKSGWYFLIILIPLVGAIWFIVLMATDSIPGQNKYGENPKELALNSTEMM